MGLISLGPLPAVLEEELRARLGRIDEDEDSRHRRKLIGERKSGSLSLRAADGRDREAPSPTERRELALGENDGLLESELLLLFGFQTILPEV